MRLDSLIVSEVWGELWRATHDTYGKILVVAYKREEGKNLFLACRNAFTTWQQLAEEGAPGLTRIHKIVSSGKVPMLLLEDPGGETAREFFNSEAATLKKTARMVRACSKTVRRLRSKGLAPVGITPDTIIRKEDAEDFPAWLIPVSPGVFGDAVRLGDGRYVSPDALLMGNPETVNADIYSLAWIWAELLARNHNLDHQETRLGHFVHYPRLKGMIRKALQFRDGHYLDPKKLEFEIDQWLENDATLDRQDFDRSMAERKEARRTRRRQKRKQRLENAESPADGNPSPNEDAEESFESVGVDVDAHDEDIEGPELEGEIPSFAGDIPPLSGPAAPKPPPQPLKPAGDSPPVASPASPKASESSPLGSRLFPLLVAMFFVFIIVSAFTAGIWILMRGGDSTPSRPNIEVAEEGTQPDVVPIDEGTMEAGETNSTLPPEEGEPTASSPEPPAGSSTPAPGLTRPDSMEALLQTFETANETRNLSAIRDLYYENREFDAVSGMLASLVSEDRELASLQFVPPVKPLPEKDGIQGVGTLRVTTSAFKLEIPVGTIDGEYFLTSVGRVGEMWTPAPTPVPTEAPLEFGETATGEWTANPESDRIARFGLGKEARAAILIRAGDDMAAPGVLAARLSNPGETPLYYRFVVAVFDADDNLLTAGGAGGSLEAGAKDIEWDVTLPLIEAVRSEATHYEALWYESEVPLGLIGGTVQKNSRVPVGFGRAYGFELGEDGSVKGRIYTEYLNNQKVVVAPGILENKAGRTLNALYAVSLLDADGKLISAHAQRAEIPAAELFAFEEMVFYLPQSQYARIHSYEAVVYLDGEEFGRDEAVLPGADGDTSETDAGIIAPPPTATPPPTPTPLASLPQPEADGPVAAEESTIEEALAALGSPEPVEAPDEDQESDWDAAWGEAEVGALDEVDPASIDRLVRIVNGLSTASFIISIVFGYFIAAFCFQKILEKTGKADGALLAWIPVLNWVLVPWMISGRSLMFPILAFTFPCVGIFFYIAMWYDVCIARNKSGAWAFLVTFIPIVGVPYLAFSE